VARAHDWQVPVQALAQQTPCWQKPEAHSVAPPQVAPLPLRPQVPVVVLQRFGATQSALDAQVALHWPLVPQIRLPPQVVPVTVPQVPVPLHRRGGVKLVPVQVAAAHCVPLTYFRHAPAPSHMPSVPHVDAVVVAHWVVGLGAAPAGTGEQVPALPPSAHDWQVPVQVELQQTPCAQKPEPQSVAKVHAAPIGFFPQLPPVQTLGETQSAVVLQVVLQAAVPQT